MLIYLLIVPHLEQFRRIQDLFAPGCMGIRPSWLVALFRIHCLIVSWPMQSVLGNISRSLDRTVSYCVANSNLCLLNKLHYY